MRRDKRNERNYVPLLLPSSSFPSYHLRRPHKSAWSTRPVVFFVAPIPVFIFTPSRIATPC